MKQFLIKYRLAHGSQEAWHQEISRFISALDSDPELAGRVSYRCMRRGAGPEYLHIAATQDDEAAKVLQTRAYFKHYTEQTRAVSGAAVDVTPLELIAGTAYRL